MERCTICEEGGAISLPMMGGKNILKTPQKVGEFKDGGLVIRFRFII